MILESTTFFVIKNIRNLLDPISKNNDFVLPSGLIKLLFKFPSTFDALRALLKLKAIKIIKILIFSENFTG